MSGKSSDVVHYVLVVHGIGEQKKNETVLPVIQRFAEARREAGADGLNEEEQPAVVTRPMAMGQTAMELDERGEPIVPYQPWLEFDGIHQLDEETDPFEHHAATHGR